ncbi:MAG: carboxypeptidase M32 [Myxococcota bacterium]
MNAYETLERRFARLSTLGEIQAVMQWDTATVMSAAAASSRADQMALLHVMQQEVLTAPDIFDLLGAAEEEELDAWARANLREMTRRVQHASAVPTETVAAFARTSARCEHRWRAARDDDDFAGVAPLLGDVVSLVREIGAAKGEVLGVTPYEALLDAFEPGIREADIDPHFDALGAWLPGFREEVAAAQAKRPAVLPLAGPFDVSAQRTLGEALMRVVGFDFEGGRLDVSRHPFCGGNPDDIRITTRYDPADFASALMGVLHESGHAMYERQRPSAWRRQPVGEARGMAVHESQSLLIEMQACRSRAFATFVAPRLREAFGGSGPAWEADNMYRRNTVVAPGFIRVDADEVNYPAHVLLRYQLERALVAGTLDVADLPEAWAEASRRHLGLSPPDDRRGCLQDIHWFDGAFGYFPSYTLGAMLAAQLFAAADRALGDVSGDLARGDFRPLVAWLGEHVHQHGSRYTTPELVEVATGMPLGITAYQAHLRERYVAGDR